MREKIVKLTVTPRGDGPVRGEDPWQAQIGARLSGIERLLRRLEWQVWGLACGASGLLVLEILRHLARV
ncbi:hypothetical protein [Loktanella sp. R86503]|uniref:hypothetical protein n=1 Tax=Loktanella sp. R86503 TaxID=3093847 RepID=UPI0036DC1C43